MQALPPLPIRRWWLYPCALLTLLSSLAFGLLGMVEQPAVGGLTALVTAGALALTWRRGGQARAV